MNTTLRIVADKAREIAAKHSFTYDSNQGHKDAFTFAVSVRADATANTVYLSADCNAQISQKRAAAEMDKVWEELKVWVIEECIRAKVVKVRGHNMWRQGFWHMGRFDTTSWARGLRLVEAE